MTTPELTFHHLGLAVAMRDKARRFLDGLGYAPAEAMHDPLQHVFVSLHVHPTMPDVELISRDDGPGPLDAVLKGRTESIYHLCYRTPDRSATLERFRRDGHRVLPVSPPTPAVLFDGRLVSFHYVAGFGLIELLDA